MTSARRVAVTLRLLASRDAFRVGRSRMPTSVRRGLSASDAPNPVGGVRETDLTRGP